MDKLTNDEINMLMDSLDALQSKSMMDGMFVGLIGSSFASDKDQAKREMEATMKEAQEKSDAIRDRVILLKAKLINMKDRNIVSEASDFLRRG